MRTYGIYSAIDERSGECKRVAICSDEEEGATFDPSDFFLTTRDMPERVGEIKVTGDDEFLDEYFNVQTR